MWRVCGRIGARAQAAVLRQQPLFGISAIAAGTAAAGYYSFRSSCIQIEIDDSTARTVLAALSKAASDQPVVGLEAFASGLAPIIAGKKTMSVRPYPFPPELIGKPILVLATPDSPEGGAKNIMPDRVEENEPGAPFQVVGVVVFSGGSTAYESRAAFDADAHRHGMVPGTKLHAKYAGDGPGWPGPLPAYGWAIQSVTALSSVPTSTPAVRRRFQGSTLFNIESEGWDPEELLDARK